jgi:hypothetical protein
MTRQAVNNFPPLEAAYTDEFGTIDPHVYQTAKEIWSPAERLAVELLHDSQKGLQLMMKAVAAVSRIRESTPIGNLAAYLYRSYKRLILAELEKEKGHQRIMSGRFSSDDFINETEDELNRKILINELRRRMDNWTREVFDYLCLEYKFKDLVPRYGTAENVIRSKYSKKVAKLARRITAEIDKIDRWVKIPQ